VRTGEPSCEGHTLGNLIIAEGMREMTRAGKAPAARFEISIDGVPRSHRDRREIAIEAAGRLMAKYPHSAVAVKAFNAGRGSWPTTSSSSAGADAAHDAANPPGRQRTARYNHDREYPP
jgi:hypothetical protein